MRFRRCRRASICILLTALAAALVSPAMAEFTVNGAYGPRSLDDPLWDLLDGDEGFVLDWTWGRQSWPVRLAFGFSYFGDDDRDNCTEGWYGSCPPDFDETILERNISEISAGIARYWKPVKRLHLYAGGGLSFIDTEVESSALGQTEEDSTVGGYAQAGVLWVFPISDSRAFLHTGIEVRYVTGTGFSALGVDADADYYQISLVFGGGMGPR